MDDVVRAERLMVPGPTPLGPGTLAAGALPMLDERTEEFTDILRSVSTGLQSLLQTRNDQLIFTASITGAMEAVVENLFSRGDRVLVCSNGVFGRRWIDICDAYGLRVIELNGPLGEAPDMNAVGTALRADSGIHAVICVHCETSTGAVADIRRLAEVAHGVLTIVDCASSAGACELRTDDWGIDVVVGGPQKALKGPPGISFVSVSSRAWARHAAATLPRFYFDWNHALTVGRSGMQADPWTPAVGVIRQFSVAIRELLDEPTDTRTARHVALGKVARAGLQGMGLTLLTPDVEANCVVTVAFLPDGVKCRSVIDDVASLFGVRLAAGPTLDDKETIRMGHCGRVEMLDVLGAVASLELVLDRMMNRRTDGHAAAAALATMRGLLQEPGADPTSGTAGPST
jgi:aspartate aminotransferase-like enzyme